MSHQSGSSHLHVLFETALQEYEKQTGIALDKHPLASQLQSCDSIESVTAVLCKQTQAFREFRGKDKILRPLKSTVSALCKLSAAADFGWSIGLHFPPVTAIYTGLAILLSGVKDIIDSYDGLVDLLESIEHFLKRLDIYTKIPPTVAMNEMVVKILVELLSTLALAAKQIKQGKPKKLVKKLLGEKDIEAVLQRLDRLTQDEARITAAQNLEVVYGLIQNMRVVMDDGKASVDHVRGALEIMQQVASDLNKSKRDSLQQDIFRWLSPPDPWTNHHIACGPHHCGSGAWFIQGETFLEWKASEARSPLLWVHGKPGAGKSVFCSTIIENVDAMRKAGLASLAFFYFDFREDKKKDLRGLLSSLLDQLCHQSDSYCDTLSKFYLAHANGRRCPSDNALAGCLKDLLKLPGLAPVYLIVDALDECPNTPTIPSPRANVLNLLEDLIKSQIPNLRVCITTRSEMDIRDVLDPLIPFCVSLHDESGQKRDIEDYIKSVIGTHPKNRRWKAEHKQMVIDVLTEKADGSFRWVYCEVAHICGLIPARIRQALTELPETLHETYQRTLREINKVEWEFAHRMFQFVAVSSRPLRVEELADLLAFDFGAGPIPKFHQDWRLEDSVDAVLSTCSAFLAIVDGQYYSKVQFGYVSRKVVQFSHFSVKEFLTSARLAGASDIITRRFHISMIPAHTLAAQTCLGILLHLDKDVVTIDSLEKWPLAEYAAENWADHARLEDVSRNVEDGMKQLLDPSKSHLAICIWIHDPGIWFEDRKPDRPLPPGRIPLHYAALWGLLSMVEFLVTEHPQDVDSRGPFDNATPLHLAVQMGHAKVARFLLESDADVTAQNDNGSSPLHLALQSGQVEIADMLIEYGADVTGRNDNESTLLHMASEMGQVEVTSMLIKHGVDVTGQNKEGSTPLHLAVRCGQLEVVGMLIEHGADVTAQTKDGWSPLHLALQWEQVEVAGMLIEHGADVTAQSEDKSTPLHLAVRCGQLEVVGILIERGADVTAQNKDGWTPLHLALQWGQMEVAGMLIERGVNVTAQDEDGSIPLHLASKWGEVEIVGMLIERGADVTAKNKDGSTPLHLASTPSGCALRLPQRYAEIARILLEHGADMTVQDKDGRTPLDLASSDQRLEVVVHVLLQYGPDPGTQDKSN